MNSYKISVVVPTYNTGKFLIDLFDSLKSQTIGFDNIEVIFVDDKSTDSQTLDLLKEFSSYDNVKVIYKDFNSGYPGEGRNIGLSEADGEYIIFTDHDDSYNPDAFEEMYKIAKDKDMIICNFNQVYPDKIIPFNANIKENDYLTLPAAIWTRLFRREFLLKNDIWFLEGMLAEDVYVAVLSTLKTSKIDYLPELYGYNYSIRDNDDDKSTIHLRNRKYIEAILNGYIEIDKMLQRENFTEYGKDIFRKHLTSWLYTIDLSNLTEQDKFELFKKAYDVFNKYYTDDPYFKGKYKKTAKQILNKNFKKAAKDNFFKKLKRLNHD